MSWRQWVGVAFVVVTIISAVAIKYLPTPTSPSSLPYPAKLSDTSVAASSIKDFELMVDLINRKRTDILTVALSRNQLLDLSKGTAVDVIKHQSIKGHMVAFVEIKNGRYAGQTAYIIMDHITKR